MHGEYDNSPAGLIPSPELQEWRIATNAIEKAKDGSGKYKSSSLSSTSPEYILLNN